MASAWTVENRMALGQRKVDGESNEIIAVPELLDSLEIAGCIVTLDAIYCQTETWVLDVTFREDECCIRKGNGAKNSSVLCQIELNLLTRETSVKRSFKDKRMKAALDENYLLKVLVGK